MSEGINLLEPNNKSENKTAARRMQVMRYIAVGMLFIVSVSSVILFIMVSLSPLPELKRQEESLRLTLSQSSTDIAKLALLNERAESIGTLLDQRKSYEQILGLLQDKLPNNAEITSIRVEQQNLIITVESRSLTALDSFINGLVGYVEEEKGFSQVTMTTLSNDEVRNDYSLTLNLVML
jgi:Tfp pilus assembly protein PilN